MKRLCLMSSIVLSIMLTFNICDIFKSTKDSIDEAVNVINEGINDITAQSTEWQNVLKSVADKLPHDISEVIRNDVQNLVTRSIAVAGAEFRCNVDFLAARAINALKRIKAKLLNQPLTPFPPAFCQVVPNAINLNSALSSWSTVTLFGYDLDYKDSSNSLFKVLLQRQSGQTYQLSETRIGRTTHYQVTLNLGNMANEIYGNKIVKLKISWGGVTAGYPEIVVIPWQPHRMTELRNMGITSYMPPRVHGDRDFNTHSDEPMHVSMQGQIRIIGNRIESNAYLRAREPRPDYTEATGWSGWAVAYTAPNNWRIVEINPRVNSSHSANISTHGSNDYYRPAGEVVRFFKVYGDHAGDEAGTWTKMEVHWNPLTITREEIVPVWH